MARSEVVDRSAKNESVTEAVVSAVAEAKKSDPLSLDPLYDAVDPDALDALFESDRVAPGDSQRRVSFTYCGCEVTVTSTSDVHVSSSE